MCTMSLFLLLKCVFTKCCVMLMTHHHSVPLPFRYSPPSFLTFSSLFSLTAFHLLPPASHLPSLTPYISSQVFCHLWNEITFLGIYFSLQIAAIPWAAGQSKVQLIALPHPLPHHHDLQVLDLPHSQSLGKMLTMKNGVHIFWRQYIVLLAPRLLSQQIQTANC